MRVSAIGCKTVGDATELSADIDGFRLWYRFPAEYSISTRGDAFLVAALQPAMRTGQPLVIEGAPVSPKLLASIDRLQDVYNFWDPAYRKIPIVAEQEPDPPGVPAVGSFFSGGIDGCHTFLKHPDEITHLIFIKGVDIQIDNDALFSEALALNQNFADAYGKKLVPVETNIRRFCHPRDTPWTTCNGGGLSSVGLALRFSRVYIASSHTYSELFPLGSHPMTDHLWSTEATEFVHDGAEARRYDKLRLLATSEPAMRGLRVCWQDAGYNCGRCEKCLRTMIGLHLLGLKAPTFPPLDSLEPVRRMRVISDDDFAHFVDNHRLAQETGHRELEAVLGRHVRNYRVRRLLIDIDRELTGGRLKRGFTRLSGLLKGSRDEIVRSILPLALFVKSAPCTLSVLSA